jgi:hypothetical protein
MSGPDRFASTARDSGDRGSAERAAMCRWLRSQGVDPRLCTGVELVDEGMAVFTMVRRPKTIDLLNLQRALRGPRLRTLPQPVSSVPPFLARTAAP